MLPTFLAPEGVRRHDGASEPADVSGIQGGTILVTLGITRIVEQERLEISIQGSSEGEDWETLAVFPQKFYCGTYSMTLDLEEHPRLRHLRASWRMTRWGNPGSQPQFGFYLFVAPIHQGELAVAAG